MLLAVMSVTILYIAACIHSSVTLPKEGVQIALDWNKFILEAEIATEGYRGPVAARAYAYIGVAAYEAALPGFNGDFVSLASIFPQIILPERPEIGKFNQSAALNACYFTILEQLFITAPEFTRQKQKEIRAKWDSRLLNRTDTTSFNASVQFGMAVAKAVFEWSATDSLGFRANHHNYDRNYHAPVGEGLWESNLDFPMPPLLPYWGKVRPFIVRSDNYVARPLPAYSSAPNSFYHAQALEIISLSKPLTPENEWIAKFWNDDRPSLTFTPAGHWLAITNQVVERERPSVEKTLISYLKVGIALNDAMVSCWHSKYLYNMERPESYIRKHITKDWRPYSPSPSFPSYPSGHSMMGAAAAVVLTNLYGDQYAMMDKSHEGLRDFEMRPRAFKSFEEMSRENALSRMLLGVHFRMDCEEGLRLGNLIGSDVVNLKLEQKLQQ